ncbi:hypothetical protein U9M48_012657 [Paspalum notatum var. saurae]|uniref:Alkyl transferase n=1 Tax=Paspalum notatum var. saurae TaxID=547442 RepID=A0AAQ3SYB3_PASNO
MLSRILWMLWSLLFVTARRTQLRAVRPESLPRHVAVVPDGNRRWAQARGRLTADGHDAGCRAVELTVRLSREWGIRVLTVFVFSLENFGRPKAWPPLHSLSHSPSPDNIFTLFLNSLNLKAEVDYLMAMIERLIRDNLDEYARNGIRLHVIGDASRQPASLQSTAREAEETTRSNSELHLILAICYSGQWDILQACRQLAGEVHQGSSLLRAEDIDEALLAGKLATSVVGTEVACPDLIIRTSGEQRLSNFLMWQSAYSELYFTDTLWPDFGEEDYLQALSSFQGRERRFGTRTASEALSVAEKAV